MPAIQQFQKLRIVEIAQWLGLHPFDVVRILTTHDAMSPNLRFDRDQVALVKDWGGIESWWKSSDLIEGDEIRPRAILRAIVGQLVKRGFVGDRTTRVDNVYRGLDREDETMARRALNLLIQERLIQTVPTPTGNHVSIAPQHRAVMEDLAEGRAMPAGLAALWLT